MFDQVYSNEVLFSPVVQVPHPVRKWPAISRIVTTLLCLWAYLLWQAGHQRIQVPKSGWKGHSLFINHLILFPFLWLSYILSPELLQICFEAEWYILKGRDEMITRN